jgi:UDP-N-acetylmuramate--alanine ligase
VLCEADVVLLAPLYAAGEAPINGISSEALALCMARLKPDLPVWVSQDLLHLAEQVGRHSREGDLVLAMGAGDVNGLWDGLQALENPNAAPALAA